MLATGLQIAGISLVAIGAGLIFAPLGFIIVGVGALLFGLALEKGN